MCQAMCIQAALKLPPLLPREAPLFERGHVFLNTVMDANCKANHKCARPLVNIGRQSGIMTDIICIAIFIAKGSHTADELPGQSQGVHSLLPARPADDSSQVSWEGRCGIHRGVGEQAHPDIEDLGNQPHWGGGRAQRNAILQPQFETRWEHYAR